MDKPVVQIRRGNEVMRTAIRDDHYNVDLSKLSMPQFKIYCKQKIKEVCIPTMVGENISLTNDFNSFVENIPDELLDLKTEEAKRLLLLYLDNNISLKYGKKIDRDAMFELLCRLYETYKTMA